MAQSTLALQRLGFQKALALLLGKGLDSTAWKPDVRQKIDYCIEVGERRVYAPVVLPGEMNSHEWSFLKPVTTNISLHAAYHTDDIQIVANGSGSIVTLNSGVTPTDGGFPTWAAAGQIVVNEQPYDVLSRTSATVLRLNAIDVTVAAGTTYSLQQVTYTLDDLFGGITGDLYFSNTGGTTAWLMPVVRTSIDRILLLQQQTNFTQHPYWFAIHPVAEDGDDFQRQYITVYPAPDADYTLTGPMTVNPHKMTESLPHPLGGYAFTELLRESCLAACESEIMGESNGSHYQLFMQRLSAAVSHDRMQANPRNLGPRRGSFDWPVTSHGYTAYAAARDWQRSYAADGITYT